MKKKTKKTVSGLKLLGVILSVCIFITTFTGTSFAVGQNKDSNEDSFRFTDAYSCVDKVFGSHKLGDINGDCEITAADARLCLKAAANMITLDEEQFKAADVIGIGFATSSAARKILRVSAGLEIFDNRVIYLYEGDKITYGPLLNRGSGMYNWECTVTPNEGSPSDGMEYNMTTEPSREIMNPGTPVYQSFTFNGLKEGVYKVNLQLKASFEEPVIEELVFNIKVSSIEKLNKQHPTGLIWDTPEVIEQHLIKTD